MGAGEVNVQEVIESVRKANYELLPVPVLPAMVVVMYQEQMRRADTQYWGKWFDCDEAQYNRNKDHPVRYGWEYRARKLFVEITENFK